MPCALQETNHCWKCVREHSRIDRRLAAKSVQRKRLESKSSEILESKSSEILESKSSEILESKSSEILESKQPESAPTVFVTPKTTPRLKFCR
jgi:hypothetical protein